MPVYSEHSVYSNHGYSLMVHILDIAARSGGHLKTKTHIALGPAILLNINSHVYGMAIYSQGRSLTYFRESKILEIT